MNPTAHPLPLSGLLTRRDTIIVFTIWCAITAFVVVVYPGSGFLASWIITIPAGWFMHHLSFRWLFPRALSYRFSLLYYAACTLLYCVVVFLGTCISFAVYMEDESFFIRMAWITFFTLLVILAPFQWVIFKRLARNHEELFALRKELGQTEANVDLLRTQINPHFLFNVLNTLYGMALQEQAARTSEGIEKLGSMMRFMLQENVQEKIPLTRDLDYLNNYIALQRLRTDTSPGIKIQIAIQLDIDAAVKIAPMLLIPFIENAFKHGISLREESLIRVSLEVKDRMLYFDVFNTRHLRSGEDPEKHSSGIGLANVRQRLKLIYPGRHELVIRQTVHDYFVHLSINLGA